MIKIGTWRNQPPVRRRQLQRHDPSTPIRTSWSITKKLAVPPGGVGGESASGAGDSPTDTTRQSWVLFSSPGTLSSKAIPAYRAVDPSPAVDDVGGGVVVDPIGRKRGRKRWQKCAAACRRLQVRETQETLKMPGNPGFLEVNRVSQLGYGDLIRKYLENKVLRQGTSQMAEKVGRKLRPFLPSIPGHNCLSHANSSRFLGRCLAVPVSQRHRCRKNIRRKLLGSFTGPATYFGGSGLGLLSRGGQETRFTRLGPEAVDAPRVVNGAASRPTTPPL